MTVSAGGKEDEGRRTVRPESRPGATTSRRVHGVHYDKALCERVVCGYTHAVAVPGYSLRSVHAHIRVACAVDARQVVGRLQAFGQCGVPHSTNIETHSSTTVDILHVAISRVRLGEERPAVEE